MTQPHNHLSPSISNKEIIPYAVGALGVVYGDIGTSPLYALKSCFLIGNLPVNEPTILGLISLFVWVLFWVVTLKYITLVLPTNNNGEGGILVLSSLCKKLKFKKYPFLPMVLGLVGASLFFGDGIITPAISILGALEGLELMSHGLSNYVIVLALLILTVLWAIQKRGSGLIGRYFGVIMVLWFSTLATLGVIHIFEAPLILKAFNPYYALSFMVQYKGTAFVVLGGTILIVTGAEALYTDLGHFGEKPIRLSWLFFVFPSLILNYLGQGALLLHSPQALENPFYLLAPSALLYPLIILATLATVIASQAIISGIFSVAWQGVMLNHIPRLKVLHTSAKQIGQVYVPIVNEILYLLIAATIIAFRSSENLAIAYGVSVSGEMLITTVLIFLLASREWKWSFPKLMAVFGPLVLIDTTFFTTNLIKIRDGAWFPLLIAVISLYMMWVWAQGNKALEKKKFPVENLKQYIEEHKKNVRPKIPGCAVFMSRSPGKVPNSLIIHLLHNKFLHEKVVFVSIITDDVPRVAPKNKFFATKVSEAIYSVKARFGFKEIPDLHKVITWAHEKGIINPDEDISYFLSKGVPVAASKKILEGFSEKLYIFLARNALPAYEFYKIPNDRVVELGVRYEV